jgi:hypothetical protein
MSTDEHLKQSIEAVCREALDLEEHRGPNTASLLHRCEEPGCKAFLPVNGLRIDEQEFLEKSGWICFTVWRGLRTYTASFSVRFRCPEHSSSLWRAMVSK